VGETNINTHPFTCGNRKYLIKQVCNKRFSVLIPAACYKGDSHHNLKTSLWSVVCKDDQNLSPQGHQLFQVSSVFLGSTQVNSRLGLYKCYTCFHSSTFLKMYVRILSPHSTIYITAAGRHPCYNSTNVQVQSTYTMKAIDTGHIKYKHKD
jgi:hypothetical protein